MYLESLFNLKGKVALVTGASSGFGLHFASVLAKAGSKVALAARRKDRIDSAAQALRSEGAEACAVYLDVSDPATIPCAFDAIENELNACIDILINNAGVIYTKRFLEQEPGLSQHGLWQHAGSNVQHRSPIRPVRLELLFS